MDNGLTYTEILTIAQEGAHDTTTATTTFLRQQINVGLQKLTKDIQTYFNDKTTTISTIASTNYYNTPEDFSELKHLYVTVGGVRYSAELVYDEQYWQRLQIHASAILSNFLTHVFVRGRTFEIYPTPSSTNVLTFIYQPISKNIFNADYTTGTITTLANNAVAVTGSGTAWTSSMIGRHFKINDDGQWYEIATVPSTTSLTITKPYQGISIAAGTSTYTIGEMPRLPGATHHIPALYADWQYYALFKKDPVWSKYYEGEYKRESDWAKEAFGKRYTSTYIPSTYYMRKLLPVRNPNWYPQSIG